MLIAFELQNRIYNMFQHFRASNTTFFINMAQPMANLAFFCLEPETPDGYAGWGLLDSFMTGLAGQGHQMIYPVFKFFKKIN
jgi:hypothetical protein